MTERELDQMMPRTLFNKIKGFRSLQREKWEMMRIHAWRTISIHLDSESDLSAYDILPFPWDKDEEVKAVRPDPKKLAEERKKIWEKFDKQTNRDVEQ